jgi:ATP-binding cassette subfamily B protein
VLLDEATASLDPENEKQIQEAVSALVKGRTVLVIAHRLKSISGVDNIIVLENGKIAEEGKNDELIEKNGLYANLYNIQQQSLGWSIAK